MTSGCGDNMGGMGTTVVAAGRTTWRTSLSSRGSRKENNTTHANSKARQLTLCKKPLGLLPDLLQSGVLACSNLGGVYIRLGAGSIDMIGCC